MRRAVFIFLIPLLHVNPRDSAPAVSGSSRLLLESAIGYYKQKRFRLSSIQTEKLLRTDPTFFSNSAAALKLKGLHALRGGNGALFLSEAERSLELSEDPRLAYLAGIVALSEGFQIEQTAQFFLKSLQGEGENRDTGIRPFDCAEKRPERPEELPFSGKPGPLDRVYARFIVEALGKVIAKRNGASQRDGGITGGSDLSALQGTEPLLNRLLTEPQNEEAHLACILHAEQHGEKNGDRYPHSLFAPGTLLLYKNRIAFFETANSYDAFAMKLLESRHPLEALHAMRNALSVAGWEDGPGDPAEISSLLARLGTIYRTLNRREDATTVLRLANAIDQYLSARNSAPPLQPILHDLCTENLHNREALLFLAKHPRPDGIDYGRRLKELDQSRDLEELRSVYLSRFPF